MSRTRLTRRALRSPRARALFLALAALGWTLLPRLTERPEQRPPGPRAAAAPRAEATSHALPREAYGNLPLSFEADEGQADPAVRFLARGDGYKLFLTGAGAVIQLRKAQSPINNPQSSILRLSLVGADEGARGEAEGELPGKSNYLKGKDPSKWRTNVPHFSRVRYREVYPGVDVVYYGNQRRLEYDFRLSPGASPDSVRLAFGGAQEVRVDEESGDLLLETPGGELRQHRPFIYQEAEGVRREVAGRYVILRAPSDKDRTSNAGPKLIIPLFRLQTPDSGLSPGLLSRRLRGRAVRLVAPARH